MAHKKFRRKIVHAAVTTVRLTTGAFLFLIFLTCLLYLQGNIYTFPEKKPFSGENLLNPYQDIDLTHTIKANLHAHSIAWNRMTNGHNSPQQLTQAYRDQGYTVACITNYHYLEPEAHSNSPVFIPAYEHGYNIFKTHTMAIDPEKVTLFDYPFWQSTSLKQDIIERLRKDGAIVCINHPGVRNGHTLADMRQLTDYSFIEVLSQYHNSSAHWDAALTAGQLAYVLGNDDTHNIHREPTFRRWNEIYTPVTDKDSILENLKSGRSYAVEARDGWRDIRPEYIRVSGDTLYYAFSDSCRSIRIVGPEGKTLSDKKERSGFYKVAETAGYVRLVASSDNCDLYMNPIVRYQRGNIPDSNDYQARINLLYTILYRTSCVIILLVLASLIYSVLFTRRQVATLIKRRWARSIESLNSPANIPKQETG